MALLGENTRKGYSKEPYDFFCLPALSTSVRWIVPIVTGHISWRCVLMAENCHLRKFLGSHLCLVVRYQGNKNERTNGQWLICHIVILALIAFLA